MLATKRYEYLQIEKIGYHPSIINHRPLNTAKVTHYESDILKNGLLEPLVVWERNPGEYFLVGGFHRIAAIQNIRKKNPTYFDRVDVRVVTGDPDEIRALNLKLNADRVDTNITDYFETVIYLNNANWSRNRIADFLDKSDSWIDEIIRFAPLVTPDMRTKLESGELSWNRAKAILLKAFKGPAGLEKTTIEDELNKEPERKQRPLTIRAAISRISDRLENDGRQPYTIHLQDLYALVLVLHGKDVEDQHVRRVKKIFPFLLSE